jgi:hypothetical protein
MGVILRKDRRLGIRKAPEKYSVAFADLESTERGFKKIGS